MSINELSSGSNYFLPDPEYITKENIDNFVSLKNEISNDVIREYSISNEDIELANKIIDEVKGFEVSTDSGVIFFKNVNIEINDYLDIIHFLIPLFYINPYITTAILRSGIGGKHSYTAEKISTGYDTQIQNNKGGIPNKFKNEFYKYACYEIDFDSYDEKNEDNFLKNNKLLELDFFLGVLVNTDEDLDSVEDFFSGLSDEKFYSLVIEMYCGFGKTYGSINYFFYKRLIQDKNIPKNIKDDILISRDKSIPDDKKPTEDEIKNNPELKYLVIYDKIDEDNDVKNKVVDILEIIDGSEKIKKPEIDNLSVHDLLKLIKHGLEGDILVEDKNYNIISSFCLLSFNKTTQIINYLETHEVKNLFKILFYLGFEGENEHLIRLYQIIFEQNGIDKNKTRKALIGLKEENPEISQWLEKEMFLGKKIIDNCFDYNVLKRLLNINYEDKDVIIKEIHDVSPYINFFEIVRKYDKNLATNINTIINDILKYFKYKELSQITIIKKIYKFKDIICNLVITKEKQEKDKYFIEKILKGLNNVVTLLGKIDFQNNSMGDLEIYGENPEEITGRAKVITDDKQLKHITKNDIVILDDYPTTYANIEALPKAIIMSKKASTFSHSVNFAQIHNIPVYYIPMAEQYLNELNGVNISIDNEGKIYILEDDAFLIPYGEDTRGEKVKGIESSKLKNTSISGSIFYRVLQDWYGDENGEDYNESINLPFVELKQLFEGLINDGSINYDDLSRRSFTILDCIEIKDDIIEDILGENEIQFPISLRSDFLMEDKGKRTPGLKESYLNIRNEEELKKHLLEMIKQDFTPQALQHKIENNINPAFCTFGAVIQEMAIKDENEAKNLLSGVAKVEVLKNGEYDITGDMCIGLNTGITDGGVNNTNLKGNILYKQESYYTIDNEKGGIKLVNEKSEILIDHLIKKFIDNNLIENLPSNKVEGNKFQFEFSIGNMNNRSRNYKFLLLQRNVV